MDQALLTSLGVSKNAAELYLAALGLGTASVMDLAKRAGIKRPTAYAYIQELLGHGLLVKVPIGKRDYYSPSNPQILKERAEKNFNVIMNAMPGLEQIAESAKGRPNVTVLEGRKGIEQIYDEQTRAQSIRSWSNLEAVQDQFSDSFFKLARAIKEREIFFREIIDNTPQARKSSRACASIAGRNYKVKVASKGSIKNDSDIYDNVLVLYRIHAYNFYVVRIEDRTITDTMKALFDMAWEAATPF